MRLYVIGGQGQIARSLREAAAANDDIIFGCAERPDVDLLRPDSVAQALANFEPDIVINPASYTSVDKAESEPDQAFALNRDGARTVAAAAAKQGVPVIHLSTDYVFDGTKDVAYVERDPASPPWVYWPFGTNFVRTILRLAAERDSLRVVHDQMGCPTYAPDIAASVITITGKVLAEGWDLRFAGVTHLAGPDALSWYDFANDIVRGAALRGGRSVPISPILTSDYPTPAARPANSRLSTARLASAFGVQLPPVEHSLASCLDRLFEDSRGEVD